jgi:hypothetical protein
MKGDLMGVVLKAKTPNQQYFITWELVGNVSDQAPPLETLGGALQSVPKSFQIILRPTG